MSSRFEETIDRFLSPLGSLKMGVIDALYFLRQDDAFVFTEGYCHPSGGLMGKVMLHPDPEGEQNIFGRRFRSSYKRVVDGRMTLIPHRQQLEMQFELSPGLDRRAARPAIEDYHVEFPLSDFKGVFEHRHSLSVAMELYPSVRKSIESLCHGMSIPLTRLGVTGSTCYGRFDEPDDDIDLVFYGSIAENKKVLRQIKEITREPGNRVFEFGRFWPIRFYWKGMMICSFFNYLREEEIPLKKCRIDVLAEDVRGSGVVADDTHSIYMPSILTLTDLKLNGKKSADLDLIIYDGSLRGEYYQGDRLDFRGRKVLVRTPAREYEALLVTLSADIAKKDGRIRRSKR